MEPTEAGTDLDFTDINRQNGTSTTWACYPQPMIPVGGIWKGDNPMEYSFTLFLIQLLLIVLTSRAVALVTQLLRQPRYVAEVLGGLVLGPSILGRIPSFGRTLFTMESVVVLEAIAHVGLIYFVFIIGLEIEAGNMRRSRRSVTFAAVCMIIPFGIGYLSGKIAHHRETNDNESAYHIFLGVTLSITSFSILARTITELKLLNTNVGIIAIDSAMFVDAAAWMVLNVALALMFSISMLTMLGTLLSGMLFVAITFNLVPMAVLWTARRAVEGEELGELPACIILMGVIVWAATADAIGINAISGAFLYGLVIPYNPVGAALVDRLDYFVEGLMLPLYYAVCGLRTNIRTVTNRLVGFMLALTVLVAALFKVAGCIAVGYMFEMSVREGLSLGLLMNTRGVIELVMLNLGRDKEVFSNQTFSILVVMSLLMTSTVNALLMLVAKPSRSVALYWRRMIDDSSTEAEIQMVMCIHAARNVPSMLGLLEALHPSKRAPLFVFALHLVELTGRASAMILVHDPSSDKARHRSRAPTPLGRSDHVFQAFEVYEQRAAGVTIQSLTAVSPYSTMHVDVCNVAEDKRVALIVLPFHKQQTVDGSMEVTNPSIRSFNQNVLKTAPCSVALLIDRSLGGASWIGVNRSAVHHAVILFLGGPDDREALSISSRMAEHHSISLTMIRFVPTKGAEPQGRASRANSREANEVVPLQDSEAKERRLDDEAITGFRFRHVNSETVVYSEKESSCAQETIDAIRSIDSIHDLYIVGRRSGLSTPQTAGLNEWSECPELGPIGDLLASADFGATASVLVVQQCKVDEDDTLGGSTMGSKRRGDI